MQKTPVKLLDVVALLVDKPEEGLGVGQVGTVVEVLAPDLDTILQKAHSFIAAANGPPGQQDSVRASVTHGVGGKEIEVPHFSLASSVAFPKEVFRFSYSYYRPDKPISSVTVDLRDYSRRVSVSGEAADKVEAISNLLENDLLRH